MEEGLLQSDGDHQTRGSRGLDKTAWSVTWASSVGFAVRAFNQSFVSWIRRNSKDEELIKRATVV
jgi:hypothetical protein